jgi:hypothetical protein
MSELPNTGNLEVTLRSAGEVGFSVSSPDPLAQFSGLPTILSRCLRRVNES